VSEAVDAPAGERPRTARFWLRALPWVLTLACFYSAYYKIAQRAASEGISPWAYIERFFAGADWGLWLAVMIPYSCLFFLIDSFAITTTVRWFNAPVRYADILPVRASSYILAILNEQVGKGAMALYLNRRNGVPGWEIGSSMVFVALVELYQLLLFSAIGTALNFDRVQEAARLPGALPLDRILPTVYALAALYLPLHLLYFAGTLAPGWKLRERQIFSTFRRARLRHYALLVAIKAPNLLLAVLVYGTALRLFNVAVDFQQLLAFLPVIFLAAAIPLPFHAGALLLWQVLFPEYPEVGVFSMVMHTFFVVFNAAIGVVFLPRANRELFGT
jgi:hypothetical protein